MPGSPENYRHIAVIAHPSVPEAAQEATEVASFLKSYTEEAVPGSFKNEAFCQSIVNGDFDLLIALGGDGTMLHAGRLSAQSGIPVLGINLGRFGFLTEIRQVDWPKALPRLFEGDCWQEHRMMLRAEQWRSGSLLGCWEVLNEIVVSRGHLVRPVHIVTSVDGRFLTTYVADGLIAATATGSTAYSLAAGGPILPPELRNILLVAVAPHLSIERAIVLAEGSRVSITVQTDHHAVLSADGQPPIGLKDGDRVDASASEHTVKFLRFQDPGYFYRNLTSHMSQNPSTGNPR
jgi:NAD+ kinase